MGGFKLAVAYILLSLRGDPTDEFFFPKFGKGRIIFLSMATGSNSLNNHLAGAPILVAEREPVARSSLSELFREGGHFVLEAADSDTAISKINNEAGLKVIMLDVEMPSWRTVVSHARGFRPAAVILGMSTQDSSRTALDAQRLGVHGYLIKPLVFDDVCETILRLITGRPLS